MRISNLFYFFFGSSVARNTGTATFGVTQASGHGTVPSSVEDSRGWFTLRLSVRSTVRTVVESVLAIARPTASASATVSPRGVQASVVLAPSRGYADVSISAIGTPAGVGVYAEVGKAGSSASASTAVVGVGSESVLFNSSIGASAFVRVRGSESRSAASSVTVLIGPDEVMTQELEDLLFLLEVA